jgi:GTP cyclohydrolase IA
MITSGARLRGPARRRPSHGAACRKRRGAAGIAMARDARKPDGAPGVSAAPVEAGGTPFERLMHELLEELGEDPTREGLRQTPARVEASLKWLTRGYHMAVGDVIGDALYSERHENLVCVRDIEIYSLCEHHLLPFFGKAHVAYLPNGRLVGLSKIPRVIEIFARRLQVQERLTDQVADALMEVLEPHGVGVVIEAYHLCMMMRGVEKQNSKTVTSALRGALLQDAKTRDEFLRLVYGGRGLE